MQETQVQSLGREAPIEKEMATCSRCLGNPMDRGDWRATITKERGHHKRVGHSVAIKQQHMLIPTWKFILAQSLQLCPTLCNHTGYSLPGSSVRRIHEARILEWVAMPSSRASSWPRDWTRDFCISCTAGRFFTHWGTWESQSTH